MQIEHDGTDTKDFNGLLDLIRVNSCNSWQESISHQVRTKENLLFS